MEKRRGGRCHTHHDLWPVHPLPGSVSHRCLPRAFDAGCPQVHQLLDHRSQGGRAQGSPHSRFGNLVFGCDVCQEVCPWNHDRKPGAGFLADQPIQTEWMAPRLLDGFREDNPYWLDDTAFRTYFRRSAVKRAKRTGMLRNVCTALGNWGASATLPALEKALQEDSAPVREHAVWALGQVMRKSAGSRAADILWTHQAGETNAGGARGTGRPADPVSGSGPGASY